MKISHSLPVVLALLHSFAGAATYEPLNAFRLGPKLPSTGPLLHHTDGNDYGTTPTGGPGNGGTIYRVTGGGQIEMVASFPAGLDPFKPQGGLVPDGAGNFWGTLVGGDFSNGAIFKFDPATNAVTTVASFTGTAGAAPGYQPTAELVNDGAGFFWGTTTSGGAAHCGTIFKIKIATGELTPVAEFTGTSGAARGNGVKSALIADGPNFFWGTTSTGGTNDLGTVFKVAVADGTVTTVVDFAGTGTGTRGQTPLGGLASDGLGNFWGTTSGATDFGGFTDAGTVFKIKTSDSMFTTVFEFTGPDMAGAHRGGAPTARLVYDGVDSMLGTTTFISSFSVAGASNGTIFKVSLAGTHTVLADFTGDTGATSGRDPLAPLVNVSAGVYRGTTSNDGAAGKGTVFEINTVTPAFTTVANFIGTAGAGTGSNPEGALIEDDAGNLWGVTPNSGLYGKGTIFKINLASKALSTVGDFTGAGGAAHGSSPRGGLVRVGDFAWGSTFSGGSTPTSRGTIFKIDLTNGAFTSVLEFGGAIAGNGPVGELLDDGNGFLWGVTQSGGANSRGTVFKLKMSDSTLTTVAEFGGANKGNAPIGGLAMDSGGNIWGTTSLGGADDFGTVFKITPGTGALETKVEFTGTSGAQNGRFPEAPLLFEGGYLWGTTRLGGVAANRGTIFKVKASDSAFTSVKQFTGFDSVVRGQAPLAGLVNDGTGKLWGTGNLGGLFFGTIFNITTAGAFTHVFDFGTGNTPGQAPGHGRLLLASDGNFYGTTTAAGITDTGLRAGGGQIFRVRTAAPLIAANVIAVTGGQVTGESANPPTTYASLGVAETGPFAGTMLSGKTKTAAIFAGDGSVRARAGGDAPTAGTFFAKFGAPSGDAALASLQVNAGGVTAKTDSVLLAGLIAGPVRIAAQEGTQHNGLPNGVTIKSFGAIDGGDGSGPVFFLATLQGTGITAKTDAALCAAFANGDVRVLASEGQPVGATTIKTIGTLIGAKSTLAEGRWRASASSIGVQLTFADAAKSQALYTIPASALVPADWTRWAGTGDQLASGPLNGAHLTALAFPPAFGGDGPAFFATLKVGEANVAKTDDTALFVADNGGLTLLAREGNDAVVANAKFKTFGTPVAGNTGRAAFAATISGAPANVSSGLWYSPDGAALQLLARVGDSADGGGKWSAFKTLALPDNSGPIFTATLATDKGAGIGTANNFGVWGATSAGVVKAMLRTGDRVTVAGMERTVKSFVTLTAATGSIGAAHGYEESGRVAVLATFTDKTVALLELAAP